MATITLGNSYRFKDYNNNKYLNILTDGTPTNNTNVTIYALDSTDMAQVWKCESYSNSNLGVSGALMKSVKNTNVVLDRYRGSSNYNNADVYAVGSTAADLRDQLVEFYYLSNGYYRIKLVYADLYLTVTSTTTYGGFNVNWQALNGNTNQMWAAELYNATTISVPQTPSEIKNKEFFVKAYGTNFNLNVYGNDTVANNTNVTVYRRELVDAQRWIARQTDNGPKLFTKIKSTHALNINTTNNNCSMYSATGNDTDSVLEFEQMADMLYRIKLHNHNKYLCISSGSVSGSNVFWTSDINSATYWEFIPEATMFPNTTSDNRKYFLENLQGLLGDTLVPDYMIANSYNYSGDSLELVVESEKLQLKATLSYSAGLANISDSEYIKNIAIDYDESTDSAELVVGNDNINISTDFSNILSGSGKTASDFMRDIALTLGDGEYAIKFEYEGPTTAVIEVARNINHLPNFLNREVNACVTITCSITLKTNFPFRFIEVLIDYLNRQFMAKVMAAVLIGVIYVLTPIDEALLVAAGTNTLATFFA